jgi:hypothetical protein
MVRKLEEFSNFLIFNSGTKSFGNSSIFAFSLLLFPLYRFLYLLFGYGQLVLVMFFVLVFSDEHE